MPSEYTKILDFNQNKKSDAGTSIFYADLECITEKTDGCKNNPETSCTAKVSEHSQSGFLMSTILSFKSLNKKHDVYRVKDFLNI